MPGISDQTSFHAIKLRVDVEKQDWHDAAILMWQAAAQRKEEAAKQAAAELEAMKRALPVEPPAGDGVVTVVVRWHKTTQRPNNTPKTTQQH